jgi:hypothetical protein
MVVLERLQQPLTGVHHEGAVGGDRLTDRQPSQDQLRLFWLALAATVTTSPGPVTSTNLTESWSPPVGSFGDPSQCCEPRDRHAMCRSQGLEVGEGTASTNRSRQLPTVAEDTPCRRAASASDNSPFNPANTTWICSSADTCRDGFRCLLTQPSFPTPQLNPLPESSTHST